MSAQIWKMMDATLDRSRPVGCADCGEAEFSPDIEAFEVTDRLVCGDCAEAAIEAWNDENGQFGVGA